MDEADRKYVDSIFGKLYVYADENGDAVAVARNSRGPNGGWTGESIATMAVPDKKKPRADLNRYARLFAASEDLLAFAHDVKNRCIAAGIPGHELVALADKAIRKATHSDASQADSKSGECGR